MYCFLGTRNIHYLLLNIFLLESDNSQRHFTTNFHIMATVGFSVTLSGLDLVLLTFLLFRMYVLVWRNRTELNSMTVFFYYYFLINGKSQCRFNIQIHNHSVCVLCVCWLSDLACGCMFASLSLTAPFQCQTT